MWLELLNSLAVAHVASSLMASSSDSWSSSASAKSAASSSPRTALTRLGHNLLQQRLVIGLTALTNIAALLSPRLSAVATGAIVLLLTLAALLAEIRLHHPKLSLNFSQSTFSLGQVNLPRWALLAFPATALGLCLAVLFLPPTPVARIAIASLGFTVLGAVEARVQRPDLTAPAMLRCILRASLQTALLVVPLALAIASVLVVVAIISDATVHLSHAYFNGPIEWGVLYLPWILQYVRVQQVCMNYQRPTLLPTKSF